MELRFQITLNHEELMDAVREYAAKFLPVVDGYHIEVDASYSYSTKAYLAKDAAPKEEE